MAAIVKTGRNAELVAKSCVIEGYKNPVAYDPAHGWEAGYWICKICAHISVYCDGTSTHYEGCSLKDRVALTYKKCDSENMVYVLGDKDSALFAPYKQDDIKKIIEIARSKFGGSEVSESSTWNEDLWTQYFNPFLQRW